MTNRLHQSLLAIVGPTASGKTALSILLAKKMRGEIISADSRQIYRDLDIGTAKPTREELTQAVHHFIDVFNPDQEYNAGEYGPQARATIQNLLKEGKQPILVGGSGLYVRAVIDGFFDGPGKNSEVREQLEREAKTLGPENLYMRLSKIDPVSAARMDATKVRRVIRALEVYLLTGRPMSDLHSTQEKRIPFKTVQFGLAWDRKDLYRRIERRVDEMMENGLLDEVQRLIKKGYSREVNALNTVGYKEAFDFLEGKSSKEEMVRLIKQNTRHFAKRQLTWFRADKRITWMEVREETDWNALAEIISMQFNTLSNERNQG
jgi:tRNA dimethylallyltransferase